MICELVLIYGIWVNPCLVTNLERSYNRGVCDIRSGSATLVEVDEPCGQVAHAINKAIKKIEQGK